MDRADARGMEATTRVHHAPRVTLNWRAVPFTCREKEGKKWKREKSGRKVLQTPMGNGRYRYWRAPRPRPRLHRRQKRRRKKQVLEVALSGTSSPPNSLTEAQVTIQVLQESLRASLLREQALKEKLQRTIRKTNTIIPQEAGDAALLRNEQAESGFKGVVRNKDGWAAHTQRQQGDRQHLGTFDTPVQAARARRDYYANIVAAAHQVPECFRALVPKQAPCISLDFDQHPIMILLDTLIWIMIVLFRTDV